MLSPQTVPFPLSAYLLGAASGMLDRAARALRESRDAAQRKQMASRLSPHLRQDTGEADCLAPAPRTLAETLKSRPEMLETMWMRSFR